MEDKPLTRKERNKLARLVVTNVVDIGEIWVDTQKKIRVSIIVSKGRHILRLHQLYCKAAEPDVWKPCKSGISIPLTVPYEGMPNPMSELLKILNEWLPKFKSIPLDDPEKHIYRKTRSQSHEARKEYAEVLRDRLDRVEAKIKKREENQRKHREMQEQRKQERKEQMLKNLRLDEIRIDNIDPDQDLINMCDVGFVSSILDNLNKEDNTNGNSNRQEDIH